MFSTLLTLFIFGIVAALVLLLGRLVGGESNRLDDRINELSGGRRPKSPPKLVERRRPVVAPRIASALMTDSEESRTRLQMRLLHAGLYRPSAMAIYLSVKMTLILLPWALGVLIGMMGAVPLQKSVAAGAILGAVGLVAPEYWLRIRKKTRQENLREALPDALDVLVICLEAGASFPAAFQRVVSELRSAHPVLGAELTIVQLETQLGLSTAEALQHFAERSDFEEIRTLASVINQSERYGGGLVRALRIHADALRQKRIHRAEERANKAATKILLPTMLFIFPGIFVILVGPAALRASKLMHGMQHQTVLPTFHRPSTSETP